MITSRRIFHQTVLPVVFLIKKKLRQTILILPNLSVVLNDPIKEIARI
jgi:hypothetical protein